LKDKWHIGDINLEMFVFISTAAKASQEQPNMGWKYNSEETDRRNSIQRRLHSTAGTTACT